jgi:hypothetical protein
MSYCLINNFTNFDFSSILIGKKIKSDENNCKYYLYYQNDINESPKDIYIRVPETRLIYGLAGHKYNQVNIPIYPIWNKTIEFIKFIKSLEQHIIEQININFEFSSLIKKKNNINYIKTNLLECVKITSSLNKKISLNDMKSNGQIDMVIKINYIWLRKDNEINKYGLTSQLYQIKYYPSPEQLNHDFIDPNNDLKPVTIVENIKKVEVIEKIEQVPLKITRMVPSINDLQNALKSLKKGS